MQKKLNPKDHPKDLNSYAGFPKLGVPFWGVPIIRIIVFWGLD